MRAALVRRGPGAWLFGRPAPSARAQRRGVSAGLKEPFDAEEFRRMGYRMIDYICDYRELLERPPGEGGAPPVRSQVSPGYLRERLPAAAPEEGEGLEAILADVDAHIMPGVTHWQSPSFFGWFAANSSPPGLVAEMLSSALGVVGFSWIASPAATELEAICLDWLGQLMGLPACFLSSGGGTGVIQSTASEATLVGLLAARARTLAGTGGSAAAEGAAAAAAAAAAAGPAAGAPAGDALRLVAYTSDQAHSAVKKACMVAGVHHLRVIPTLPEHNHALQPGALEAAIQADLAAALLPCFLCATIGTTSSCAVDPIGELGRVAQKHNVWLHVDAAWAGTFAILPELRRHFQGLELADSLDTNPHKGLLTNFDCSTMWFSEGRAEWARAALSLTPVFLKHHANDLDYKDLQVPLGRKFRALKLWFVMRMYGAEGLQAFMRSRLECQQAFQECLAADPRFRLAPGTTPAFGLVCFQLADGQGGNEAAEALLEAVNASGKTFLVHTTLDGVFTFRLAVGSVTTQPRHVEAAWRAIVETLDELQGLPAGGGIDAGAGSAVGAASRAQG